MMNLNEVKEEIERLLKDNNYLLMVEDDKILLVKIKPEAMECVNIDEDVLILND